MNQGPIRIEALEDEDEMIDLLSSSVDELTPTFDLRVGDERAQLGEISITDVQFQGDMVHVTYEFDWSSYYGCDDMNGYGEEDGVVTGVLEAGYWVFQRFVPPPERSTFEEF